MGALGHLMVRSLQQTISFMQPLGTLLSLATLGARPVMMLSSHTKSITTFQAMTMTILWILLMVWFQEALLMSRGSMSWEGAVAERLPHG